MRAAHTPRYRSLQHPTLTHLAPCSCGRKLVMPNAFPHVVVVAGFDPTGGPGLVRDAITARALGATVHLVATAVTEPGWGQRSTDGFGFEPRPPARVAAALTAG